MAHGLTRVVLRLKLSVLAAFGGLSGDDHLGIYVLVVFFLFSDAWLAIFSPQFLIALTKAASG